MATLEPRDSNIVDAETINWRLYAYPLVASVIFVLGGFGYYYYLQNERDELEAQARAVLLQAKTPDEFVKVADQFPKTDQAMVALLSAADGSFNKKDYDAAIKAYQRIIDTIGANEELIDSAQLGMASAFEAKGSVDDAIHAYMAVAQRGNKSPYAPSAYLQAARIYDRRGDKDNERKILTEAASLGTDSSFVKQAQIKLKDLNAAPAQTVPVGNAPTMPPAAPAPDKK